MPLLYARMPLRLFCVLYTVSHCYVWFEYSSIACVCQLSAEFTTAGASAAGFAIFAIVVMPMLKVDPNEYKELMGDKQAKEALAGGSSDSTPAQPRLR
jgi:DMSO/TMAO reductase YedYZ heme-binding membrane subunit